MRNLAIRGAMMCARTGVWSDKPLPYDAEVEWIKNVVGSYIDTGVIADSLCNISCSFISSATQARARSSLVPTRFSN